MLARELHRVECLAAPEPIVLGTGERTTLFNAMADLWERKRYYYKGRNTPEAGMH